MDFEEALFRNSLAQNFFPAGITDEIQRNTAQRRAKGSHRYVKKKALAILVDVGCDDSVNRHTEQRAVRKSDDEYTPDSEHFQKAPDPRGVARQKMSDGFQENQLVYVIGTGIRAGTGEDSSKSSTTKVG